MSFLKKNEEKILTEIVSNTELIYFNNKVFRARQGNIDPIFEERLKNIKSEIHRNNLRAFKTLPNYFSKCVDKLTQIYNFTVEREFDENQALFQYYTDNLDIDNYMCELNDLCNTSKAGMLEIFFNDEEGILDLRTIPNDRFWVWTDSKLNVTNPKVVVKFIKDLDLTQEQKKRYNFGNEYWLYSKDEFKIVNFYAKKNVRKGQKPYEIEEIEYSKNPLGFLPFVYANYDRYNMIPEKDSSLHSFIAQPGMSITSMLVAQHYQGNPLRVLVNVDVENSDISINPEDAIMLNSKQDSDLEPKLLQIASSLDLSKALELNKSIIEDFFYTKNCTIKKDATADKSGLAIMIESVDTLEDRKKQITYFKKIEREFWNKVALYHNWLINNKLNDVLDEVPREKFDKERYRPTIKYQLPSAEAEQANKNIENNDSLDSDRDEEIE